MRVSCLTRLFPLRFSSQFLFYHGCQEAVPKHSTLEPLPPQPGYNGEGWSSEKQLAPDIGGLQQVSPEDPNIKKQPRSKRNRVILALVAIIIALVILAAVLGGVLGSRHSTAKVSSSLPSPSNSSNASLYLSPTQRNIAAVSFLDDSGNNTRLFLQDNAGNIIRGVNNDQNRSLWKFVAIGSAKNGSTLTAAISPPGSRFVSPSCSRQSNGYC
jgi:hypothetical protein